MPRAQGFLPPTNGSSLHMDFSICAHQSPAQETAWVRDERRSSLAKVAVVPNVSFDHGGSSWVCAAFSNNVVTVTMVVASIETWRSGMECAKEAERGWGSVLATWWENTSPSQNRALHAKWGDKLKSWEDLSTVSPRIGLTPRQGRGSVLTSDPDVCCHLWGFGLFVCLVNASWTLTCPSGKWV